MEVRIAKRPRSLEHSSSRWTGPFRPGSYTYTLPLSVKIKEQKKKRSKFLSDRTGIKNRSQK